MSYNWLKERGWIFYSFSFHQLSNQMSHVSVVTTDGRGGGGVVVVGCLASVLWGEMLICCAFRRRRCSFVSCFQWIVNKQRLLSLQRRDGWLVSVLVSAAVSAIPIPNRYHWYRPDTDTEYWYRSKPSFNWMSRNVEYVQGRNVQGVDWRKSETSSYHDWWNSLGFGRFASWTFRHQLMDSFAGFDWSHHSPPTIISSSW